MRGTDDNRRRTGGCLPVIVLAFLLTPALYVLSLGPAAWCVVSTGYAPGIAYWEAYSFPARVAAKTGYADWISVYINYWVG